MSSLGDLFDFDEFWLKNQFKDIGDDPWRMLVGSIDPVSTELWNGILGRDDQPLINALGGPPGSGFAGLGSGGIYDDFAATGGDPSAGNTAHNIAESVTAGSMLGGAGGGQGFGKGGGTSGGPSAPAGDGGFFSGLDFQDPNTYMRLAQNMPQGGGGLPMTAGSAGESEQERLERQHREALIAQAIRIEEERKRAAEQNAIPGIGYA